MQRLLLVISLSVLFTACTGGAGDPGTTGKSPDTHGQTKPKPKTVQLGMTAELKRSTSAEWGMMYDFEIVRMTEEVWPLMIRSFTLGADEGREEWFPPLKEMVVGKKYVMQFIKTEKIIASKELEAGVNGFLDDKGIVWELSFMNHSYER